MVGILAEKPSAAKNFAKALGGRSGTYNGEQYVITQSHGHLYGLATPPQTQVIEEYRDDISHWSFSTLPWNEKIFQWRKVQKPKSSDTLKQIKDTLSPCNEICIATDDDPSGEGQLLGWEIVHALGLDKGRKVTRMYFPDETEKSVRKAFASRKTLPRMEDDPEYKKAFYRERWDYLSMQFSRIATLSGDGHSVLRQGRLKSAMVVLVGNQLDAIAHYKKVPYYQNRFKDENGVVYSNPDEPSFPKRSDVPDAYHESDVILDSKEIKHTPPEKLLDLSSLSAILAAKGVSSSVVLNTYQKMYEDHILSYPRTEDKFVSPEQFKEMLPLVDRIADVVGVDKSLLTHRTMRKTHVKNGGSHGANRPGTTVPSSLSALNSKYGSAASLIYETLAKNFLAMFAEDYEYEQQKGHVKDYPKFTGSTSIPKKQGWKAVFSDASDTEPENTNSLGTKAAPFIYEGFPKRPASPTMKWLMKQLEKYDIGTGATRTSTYTEVTRPESKSNPYPLLIDKKGKISMTKFGKMSWEVSRGSKIADLAVTKAVQDEMKQVSDGTLDPEVGLSRIQNMVRSDMKVMNENGKTITKQGSQNKERFTVEKDGKQWAVSRIWSGYRFTDQEVQELSAGNFIEFDVVGKSGDKYHVKGHLDYRPWKGKTYLVFQMAEYQNLDPMKERASGIWKETGKEISFKRIWGAKTENDLKSGAGYRFTDDDCQKLLNGETIHFSIKRDDNTYNVSGNLAKQTWQGHSYVGFNRLTFENADPEKRKNQAERYQGTFRKKSVSFSRVLCGHRFTDEECRDLCAGKTINVYGMTSKKGKTFNSEISLTIKKGRCEFKFGNFLENEEKK